MEILVSSPFGHFFCVNRVIIMEKFVLKSIIESYDMERNEFSIHGCSFSMSSEEAALCLGLPVVGRSISLRKRPRLSDCLSSYLCKNSRRGREQFFEGAKEALRKGDDENAARLLILLLFSTVLFPAPNQSTPPALIPYVSDLSGLWPYKWGDEVFRYLMDGVRHAVEARRAGRTSLTLHRCSLLLVVSLNF